MGVTLAINECATPDRVQTIQAGSDPRWEGGKEIATRTTVESHFIHHNFLQFGKNIHDIRSLARPLFCQISVVENSSSLLQLRSRYETGLTNITEIAPPL